MPKGLVRAGEPPMAAAFREFSEETGFTPAGVALALPPVQAGRNKLIHPFALYGDVDPAAAVSNRVRLEWPKASGRIWRFPEIDKIAWFSLPVAHEKILPLQRPILIAATQAASPRPESPRGPLHPAPSRKGRT